MIDSLCVPEVSVNDVLRCLPPACGRELAWSFLVPLFRLCVLNS